MSERELFIPETETHIIETKQGLKECLNLLSKLPIVSQKSKEIVDRYFLAPEKEGGLSPAEYWSFIDNAVQVLEEKNPELANFIQTVGSETTFGEDTRDICIMMAILLAEPEIR